ncbi:MAG: hypothetical protein ABJF88_09295 [Rhodothermales bacterium]
MRLARLLPVLLLLVATAVSAQQTAPAEPDSAGDRMTVGDGETARGVVWRQPDSLDAALRDLRAMRDAGITAVRTDLVTRGSILRTADLFGLVVYQELAVADLPAARLADTLAFAQRELGAALALAQGHPSARAFGLARFADTSTPEACAYFRTLTDLVRSDGPAGARTYYVSRFVEDDVCDETVDLVLLDARERDPLDLIERWRAGHDTPVGIGFFGAPVNDEVRGGYRTPRSPASQARFIEDGLGALFSLEPAPAAVFVFRWRDGVEAPFGLLSSEDARRPAYDVVRGFYTGRQRVFAFDAGTAPIAREGASTFVLLGWAIVILLAVLLWLAPRFRQIVPRYFTRHAYYRETLQRGRAAEDAANLGLAAAVVLSAGLIGAVALEAATQTVVIEATMSGLQPITQARVLRVLDTPWAAILMIGLFYAVWLVLNMVWMLLLAGKRHRIRPAQALTLAVWSRWQVLALMVGAVLLAAQSAETLRWVPLLLSLWAFAELVAGVRMLYDFGRVTRVPMPRALVLGLGVPLVLALVLGAGAFLVARPELSFLWHLATKQ